MNINGRIRELIDARNRNPYSFNDSSIKDSIINYTECADFEINDSDLSAGLDKLYKYAQINEFSLAKSCIIFNSVNGKVAKHIADNIHIYCLDNDYYCSEISQIVNDEKNKMDKIEFLFSDISQFFTFKNNNNFLADFVINISNSNNHTYKKLDFEMKYRVLTPHQYQTLRSLHFVSSGGVVCMVLPITAVDSVVNQVINSEIPVQVLNKTNFTKGYTFLYLKKI